MSDQTFTKEQVDEMLSNAKNEWVEKEFNPVQTELEQVKARLPKEPTDEEKQLQQKQQELFKKELSLTLKEKGLGEFVDFFKVESIEQLNEQTEKFNKILSDKKITNSYKPEDHKSTDKYSQFEKDKNTVGMIGSKLSSLFK